MSTNVTPLPESYILHTKLMELHNKVYEEYVSARKKFGPFDNAHEGYAVILEELDEIWDHIRCNSSYSEMEIEVVQLATMVFAFWIELVQGVK